MATALGIDTCGGEGYVAVFPIDEVEPVPLSERHLGARATQEELLPAVNAVLTDAGVSLGDLCAIAVVSGPGSFTGVRIGLATAKGLCEAASVPLVTVSRLQVLADAVTGAPVWAWLHAGRGDVYASLFAAGGRTGVNYVVANIDETLVHAQIVSEARAAELAGTDVVAVCEEALRSRTPGTVFVQRNDLEQSLRNSAAEAIRAGRWSDVALADALYLRVPDAELALKVKQG